MVLFVWPVKEATASKGGGGGSPFLLACVLFLGLFLCQVNVALNSLTGFNL